MIRRTLFGCFWSLFFITFGSIASAIIINELEINKFLDRSIHQNFFDHFQIIYLNAVIIVSLVLGITGTWAATLPGTKPLRKCPYCSEWIKPEAKICKHCKQIVDQ